MSEEVLPTNKQLITPHIVVNNGVEALQFYEKFMGAKILRKVFDSDNKKIMHADFVLPNNAFIMLCDHFPECSQDKSLLPQGSYSPVVVHLQFQNDESARSFWQNIKQNQKEGFVISMEYAKQFWNENYGKFEDKYGHSWSIGSPLDKTDDNVNDTDITVKTDKKESGFRGLQKFGEQIGFGVQFIINKETGYDFGRACHEGMKLTMEHCHEHSLFDKIDKCISISPDNPEVVKDCRYIPGVILKSDKVSADDLKQIETERVKLKILPDIDWYVYEHVGAYSGLSTSWKNAISDIANRNLSMFGGDNFFEWYVSQYGTVPESELITRICIGVKNKQENKE